MTTSRRDFIKTAGVAAGALSLTSLPAWISDVAAAEEAAANGVDKNALADIAINTAKSWALPTPTFASIAIATNRSPRASSRCRTFRAVRTSASACACFTKARGGSPRAAASRRTTCDESRSRPSTSRAQIRCTNASAFRWSRSKRSSPPGRALSKKIHSTSRSTTRSSFCCHSTPLR